MATEPIKKTLAERARAVARGPAGESTRPPWRLAGGLAALGAVALLWACLRFSAPDRDIDAILARAEADFSAAQYDAAERALAELARVPPNHRKAAEARLLAGRIQLRRDRVRIAEASLLAALELDPKLVQAHRELIYIYGMQLRRSELSAQFLALSALTPLSSENLFHWCLLRTGSWEPREAVEALGRYVSADPLDRWSRLALAENERRMGQNDSAESVLAPLPSDDPQAIAIRAQIAIDRPDPERAERLLAHAKSDDPALARLRGKLALTKRDALGAERHFRAAFQVDPDDRETVFGLICALELAGKSEAAAPFRELARKLDRLSTLVHRAATPEARREPALLRDLGAACAALDRSALAKGWYEQAIALDPTDSESQKAIHRLREEERAVDRDVPR